MTIIVAKKYSDKIVVAADKQETWNEYKKINCNKIFQQNDLVFCMAGSAITQSLLIIFLKTRGSKILKKLTGEEDVINFLIKFYEWAKKKNNKAEINDDQYIIVVEKNIFCACGVYVNQIENYCAIGSGRFLALVALECGATAEKTVEVISKYDLYCSGGVNRIEIKLENSE